MRKTLAARTLACVALLSLVFASAVTTHAGDKDFSLAVDHIKQQYHASRKGRFSLGLAGLMVHFARPAGVKSMKLAIFEDLTRRKDANDKSLDAALREGLGPEWHAMVKVRSRVDREEISVYTRQAGAEFEVLVATIDGDEAAVIKAKVNLETLTSWLSQHQAMGHDWGESGEDGESGKSGGPTQTHSSNEK